MAVPTWLGTKLSSVVCLQILQNNFWTSQNRLNCHFQKLYRFLPVGLTAVHTTAVY
jgi:hypothetical protein